MKKIILFCICILSFLLISCKGSNEALENMEFNETCGNEYQSAEKKETGYQTITAEEAKAMMEDEPDVVILDVRTVEEYNETHIPSSVLLPNESIDSNVVSKLEISTDTAILIYCRSGNRSKDAASKLCELGYLNVYDFGGIKDWPYETE